MSLSRTVERVGKNHEILVLRTNLSTNTVPTDPYVIKVLVLEGQLRHISRHLVQSSSQHLLYTPWVTSFAQSHAPKTNLPLLRDLRDLNIFRRSQLDSYPIELKSLRRDSFHWKRHQSGGWWPACRRVKLNLCQSWCHANIIPWVG